MCLLCLCSKYSHVFGASDSQNVTSARSINTSTTRLRAYIPSLNHLHESVIEFSFYAIGTLPVDCSLL